MKTFVLYLMNKKGLKVLEYLINNKKCNHIKCVITSEDKNVIKDYCDEIIQLCNDNNILVFNRKEEKNIESDYKIAVGWRWLITNSDNLIVLHDSILPKYRGFAPLVNSLINNEKEIGVSALFATNEYDKGDILIQKSIKITYPIRIEKAIDIISNLYQDIILAILNKCDKGNLQTIKQDDKIASYSLWRNQLDYFINWKWDSNRIERFVDAVSFPYDYAKSKIDNKTYRIIRVKSVKDVQIVDRINHCGKIIYFEDENPIVVCGNGLIKIIEIQNINGGKIKISKFRTIFK